MKDSYVLGVLKRRIYHGKSHDTKLDDLKIASTEILDYYDGVIESSVKFAEQQLLTELLDHSERVEKPWGDGSGWDELSAIPVSVIERLQNKTNDGGRDE